MSWLEFLSPWRLVLLVVPVLLGVGYLLLQARRRRYALRFTSVELLDEVAPDRPGWRRHVTAVVLLLGIVVGALAPARPTVADEVTETRRIVVLAIDTSLSMEATDVDPSRVAAAKEAAGRFLDEVPDGVAVGVVGFDGQARQLIQPTTRLDAVRRVIDQAELGQGTAIGDAVIASVEAIETARDDEVAAGTEEAPGSIVLLSDGETTQGTPNEEGAALARERGIPVNTIAFGTDGGSIVDPTTGDSVPVPVNRAALAELAESTDGQVLEAQTAEELRQVYEDLATDVAVEAPRREVTDVFAIVAVVLTALAAAGALAWAGRLP